MITVILVVHILLALGLIGVVLIQRSEGGMGSMGGSSLGSFMSVRGQKNFLTRVTTVLACGFFATTLTLAILSKGSRQSRSVLTFDKPTEKPDVPIDTKPVTPVKADVPVSDGSAKSVEAATPKASIAKNEPAKTSE
jgi:preprotein translocase subunit SecG